LSNPDLHTPWRFSRFDTPLAEWLWGSPLGTQQDAQRSRGGTHPLVQDDEAYRRTPG
jgi:hypothetical protein